MTYSLWQLLILLVVLVIGGNAQIYPEFCALQDDGLCFGNERFYHEVFSLLIAFL